MPDQRQLSRKYYRHKLSCPQALYAWCNCFT